MEILKKLLEACAHFNKQSTEVLGHVTIALTLKQRILIGQKPIVYCIYKLIPSSI